MKQNWDWIKIPAAAAGRLEARSAISSWSLLLFAAFSLIVSESDENQGRFDLIWFEFDEIEIEMGEWSRRLSSLSCFFLPLVCLSLSSSRGLTYKAQLRLYNAHGLDILTRVLVVWITRAKVGCEERGECASHSVWWIGLWVVIHGIFPRGLGYFFSISLGSKLRVRVFLGIQIAAFGSILFVSLAAAAKIDLTCLVAFLSQILNFKILFYHINKNFIKNYFFFLL